jgi:hypothetical protein
MWPEPIHDLWVTILVPTLLLAVARYFPRLLVETATEEDPE